MKILVACIGNIFHGDDGFGVEVARRFVGRSLPPDVTVKDFGIRSFDLAYALMDPHDFVVLVDACSRGGEPGSIYVIDPEPVDASTAAPAVEGHSMNPVSVLRMVASFGATPPPMVIVGCEPQDLGSLEEGKLGLTEVVMSAVDEAVQVIENIVEKVNALQFPLNKGELWSTSTVKIPKPGTRCSSLEEQP